MSSLLRMVHQWAAYDRIRKSAAAQALVRGVAERIAGAAASGGGQYEVRSSVGATRARAAVITADRDARKSEAKNKTLTRAIGSGRG